MIQQSALGGRRSGAIDGLADLTGDGALDSVRLKIHPNAGPIVEIMGSWADHGMCGFNRYQLPGADLTRRVIFGNTDLRQPSRHRLPRFQRSHADTSDLRRQVVLSGGANASPPGAASDPGGSYLLADYDSDGKADLFSLVGRADSDLGRGLGLPDQ